jgi:DNA polymerase-3 subunit alpha
VAGVITKAATFTSKNGKPFGRFSIEDYNGSQEVMLFGQEYLKLSYMIVPGQFVYIKAKVELKWNQIDAWELKPQTIDLLQDIRDKKARRVTLSIKPQELTADSVNNIEELVAKHKGKCELRIHVEHNGMSLNMFSRKYNVNPTNEFFKNIDDLGGILYKVN